MCLRFAFLLITRVATWLLLSRRERAWQTAEILILRHQLAVLQRRQPRRPRLTWADRALLAGLLSVIPKARRQGLRLLVTPDTILRWHRDIVRCRWAARFASFAMSAGRHSRRAPVAGMPIQCASPPCSPWHRDPHLGGSSRRMAVPRLTSRTVTAGPGCGARDPPLGAVIGCGSSAGWPCPNGTFCAGLALVICRSRASRRPRRRSRAPAARTA